MDYIDRLRRFAVNDPNLDTEVHIAPRVLDPRDVALTRLAALVAVGGAEPTYGSLVDEAVTAGATTAEIVDVLAAVVPVVGLARVVAAAPKLALGLGHDLYAAEAD
ncbi:carboxymuconolactone decarboxylase family protein [Isoptericola sp. F-RaC21]|uniref:carboxymuconolactone decarboxylase family protein n=1 Tax=Isoptericola sp. F-RaC21 TaxID=3141452 RepID=UPI00315BAF06